MTTRKLNDLFNGLNSCAINLCSIAIFPAAKLVQAKIATPPLRMECAWISSRQVIDEAIQMIFVVQLNRVVDPVDRGFEELVLAKTCVALLMGAVL